MTCCISMWNLFFRTKVQIFEYGLQMLIFNKHNNFEFIAYKNLFSFKISMFENSKMALNLNIKTNFLCFFYL